MFHPYLHNTQPAGDPERWLALERLDYSRVGEHWAVLRLLAGLSAELGAPAEAKLVVQRGPEATTYPARACALERRLVARKGGVASELLWRASFALPLEVVEYGNALFELAAPGRPALALPTPELRFLRPQALLLISPRAADAERYRGIHIGLLRHRLAALATAVAVTATSTPAIGMAAASALHNAPVAGAPARPAAGHVTNLVIRLPAAHRPDPAHAAPAIHGSRRPRSAGARKATPRPKAAQPAVKELSSDPPQAAKARVCQPKDTTPSAIKRSKLPMAHEAQKPTSPRRQADCLPAAPGTPPAKQRRAKTSAGRHHASPGPQHASPGPQHASPGAGTGTGTAHTGSGAGIGTGSGTPSGRQPSGANGRSSHGHAHPPVRMKDPSGGAAIDPLGRLTARPPIKLPSTPAPKPLATGGTPTLSPTPAGASLPSAWTGTVSTDPSLAGAVADLSGLLANGNQPPAFLIPIYMEAGRRYHIPWEVLAGINAIETDYGRDLSTSSSGAIGWMQFMPGTWREYGLAADGHSVPNPFDPRDAIFSAARYLAANGATSSLSGSIFAYNHATWYVDQVLARARAIASQMPISRITVNRHGVISVDIASAAFKHGVSTFRGGNLYHYTRLIAAANMVSAANFPYLYGGGHEQPALFGPFDCSGAVSYVMQQAGYDVPTTVSGDIPSWGFPAGPGAVTIFYNPTHTFMRIGNRYFGTSGFARPGGGAGWFDSNELPASYLAGFSEVHVPHLGKNFFAPPTSPLGSSGVTVR